MTIQHIISTINKELISAFALLDRTFDEDEEFLSFSSGGWTVGQILEHVTLTNHYLLLLIKKGADKAIRRAETIELNEAMFDQYEFVTPAMEEIAAPTSFQWINPDHMNPSGKEPLDQVRSTLRHQLGECLDQLDLLKNGEGILHTTTMTVNNLGKLDVYQYIYFLTLHVKRHIAQIEKLFVEYEDTMEMG
ncbi:MAG TPA: DinB family protein [Cyclobacteriaceae bacterium]|nr:DinB family protein [Cyclobacteriaceae bacterium]